MKDNLDIEKLFKDKFENFEADVNPNLWNNISKGIQTTSNVTSTGLSLGVKALLIGTAMTVVGIATYYLGDFNIKDNNNSHNQPQVNTPINQQEDINTSDHTDQKNNTVSTIIAEENDPIIEKHQNEIVEELKKHQNQSEQTTISDNTQSTNNGTTQTSDNTTVNNQPSQKLSGNQQTNTTQNTADNTVVNSNDNSSNNGVDVKDHTVEYPSGKIEISQTDNKFEYNFSSNALNYEKVIWHFGDGQSSNQLNPSHQYQNAGEYQVSLTVISKDNEVYEESKTIVIESTSSIDNIPNVITPNGDRINDEFVIKTTNIEEFNIVIKDKFGNVMFESNDVDFSWDGSNPSGERVENGIYIYYIFAKGTDGSIFKVPGQIYVR